MDARAPADCRQVFLTYRDLFTGKDVRKRKTIRKVLLNHLPRPTSTSALRLRCRHQDQLEANRTLGLGLRCLAILDAF
jgi:hypothetical protein